MERRCDNCEWWDMLKADQIETNGNCRRRAPLFMVSQIYFPEEKADWPWPEICRAVFPITAKNDWCGEFKEKATK